MFTPRKWQLKYLFALGASSWVNHTIIVCLTFLTQHPSVLQFQLWLGAMLSISISMGALSRFMDAKPRSFRELKIGGWLHSLLTLGAGVTWGLGAMLSAGLDAERFLIYTLALGGTALGVVSSQHSVLRSCFSSVWSAIILLAVAHNTSSQLEGGWMTPAMMLVYGLVLTVMGMRMHRFVNANHDLNKQLTQRIRTEERLTQRYFKERERANSANLAKSRFLAHASHDLRQPVQAIAVLAENLGSATDEKNRWTLIEGVKSSVSSLAGLMKSLLDLSALDLGKIRPNIKLVKIDTLFNRLESLNSELAAKAGCDLKFKRSELTVKTDPDLLLNILQNLLSNAFKYAAGAPVLVDLVRHNDTVSLCVIDNGPGISVDLKNQVFSEFYRGADTLGVTEGLGLGLTLVEKYAKLLGLEVRLNSQPGSGVKVELAGLETTTEHVPLIEEHAVRTHKLNGFGVSLLASQTGGLGPQISALKKWGCAITVHETLGLALASQDVLIIDATKLLETHSGSDFSSHHTAEIVAISDQGNQSQIEALPKSQNVLSIDRKSPASKLRALLTSIAMR